MTPISMTTSAAHLRLEDIVRGQLARLRDDLDQRAPSRG
jgi:hypothetical protein